MQWNVLTLTNHRCFFFYRLKAVCYMYSFRQLKRFSFYRVAGEVALSIKTGKTESMNNPVSKNKLKDMYEGFRQEWPKIKNHLKSNNENPESVSSLIKVWHCPINIWSVCPVKVKLCLYEVKFKSMIIEKVWRCRKIYGAKENGYRQTVWNERTLQWTKTWEGTGLFSHTGSLKFLQLFWKQNTFYFRLNSTNCQPVRIFNWQSTTGW